MLLGTYTITETVAPLGYTIDAYLDARVTRCSVRQLDRQVIGVQGFKTTWASTDESDFHNSLIPVSVGSIAWEKAGTLPGRCWAVDLGNRPIRIRPAAAAF